MSAQLFVSAVREHHSVLAAAEKRALVAMAARMPARINSDHLTALSGIAMLGAGASFWLAAYWPPALALVVVWLAINWFGDSLDGTLARVRRIERPRYGFYLDHLTDAYSTIAIGFGLGLSPYMLLAVGLAIVVAYLVLSINVYLETHAFGEFTFSYGALGPTEVRLVLIALNLTALVVGPLAFTLLGVGMTVFDVAGLAIVIAMGGLLASRVDHNLTRLAALEPARRTAAEEVQP